MACGLALAVTAALVMPWSIVIAAWAGLFVGGMWVDTPRDDRLSRKRIAHRVGLVSGAVVAVSWGALVEIDSTWAQRVGLAATLGIGAGLAALAATLVGMDARGTQRAAP